MAIPVLLYHSISDTRGSWGAVSRSQFAAHVEAICASGRSALSISELAAGLRGERPLPQRAVVVTFDDGYDDTYEAVEILCAAGLAATVYLTTEEIGAPGRPTPSQVTGLARMEGVEVGSHAVRHRRLDELSDRELAGELGPSKRHLEELIGDRVRSFAYPHGAYDRRVRSAVVAAGYHSAVAVKNALSHASDDPYAIARWTVTEAASPARVADVLDGSGLPLAWAGERLRTRAFRVARRQRRRLWGSATPELSRAQPRSPHAVDELSMAVVVCTSTYERMPLLCACVDSLVGSDRPADELFVVVDGPPSLERELAGSLPSQVRVLRSRGDGLSAARNTGLAAASADLVAFVDDDACVEHGWLGSLAATMSADAAIVGAGGPVVPVWEADRRWMPDELLWVVGCTYGGHRVEAGPIRNPIGCNMVFRRLPLLAAGGFCSSFGKRGATLQTCDETELGLRLEQLLGPGRIVFVPDARVNHFVPAHRVSWRLLVRRSISEGLAKGRLRRLYRRAALGPERSYVRLLLIEAVPRLLRESIRRRDRQLAAGALAIAVSLVITAAAFVAGLAVPRDRDAAR